MEKDSSLTNKAYETIRHQIHNELVALSGISRLVKSHDGILLQLTRMRFLSGKFLAEQSLRETSGHFGCCLPEGL